jgi:hypothetical protein
MALANGLRRKDVVFAHSIKRLNYDLNVILTYQDKMIYDLGSTSTDNFVKNHILTPKSALSARRWIENP